MRLSVLSVAISERVVEAELAPGRLLFRFVAAAYERRALGISSTGAQW